MMVLLALAAAVQQEHEFVLSDWAADHLLQVIGFIGTTAVALYFGVKQSKADALTKALARKQEELDGVRARKQEDCDRKSEERTGAIGRKLDNLAVASETHRRESDEKHGRLDEQLKALVGRVDRAEQSRIDRIEQGVAELLRTQKRD